VTQAANVTSKSRQARRRKPGQASAVSAETGTATAGPTPRQDSKIGQVLALLQREVGATLEEMVATTGWLPHTTRATLTGLKKKGYIIERSKRGETNCYRVKVSA
jgi:predicted GNAT superfamily acetyltransferase